MRSLTPLGMLPGDAGDGVQGCADGARQVQVLTVMPDTAARPTLRPRKMNFPFADHETPPPRYWMAGSRLFTHMSNGINLLFPKGERFFIRSVQAFVDELDDPELVAQVRGFMAQEVRHGMEHESFFALLEAQGYDVQTILDWYDRVAYQWFEPKTSPELRLAATAALEHYTAMFGEFALTDGLPHAHPALRDLLLWHAAEEIEHKSVAFDVLQAVNPSYSLRVQGMLMATLGLLTFWFLASRELILQDAQMGLEESVEAVPTDLRGRAVEAYQAFWERPTFRGMARGFLDYLRPDFHPDQHDNYPMAKAYLEGIGRLDG